MSGPGDDHLGLWRHFEFILERGFKFEFELKFELKFNHEFEFVLVLEFNWNWDDLHVVEHLEFRLNWVNDNDLDLLDIVVLQHVQHELQFQLIELDRLNWRLHILGWYLRHREHLGLDRLDWVHWLWKRAPVWWQSIGDSRLDQPCLQ